VQHVANYWLRIRTDDNPPIIDCKRSSYDCVAHPRFRRLARYCPDCRSEWGVGMADRATRQAGIDLDVG
jgi:hypothetical protein